MSRVKELMITLLGVLIAATGIFLIKSVPDPQNVMKTLPYLCIGIGCGLFGHGLGAVLIRKSNEKNPEAAKQAGIEKNDERNIMIGNAAKAKGFEVMIYVFSALVLVYVLMGTSYAVIIPFVIAYLFVLSYAMYFRIKLEKEQ